MRELGARRVRIGLEEADRGHHEAGHTEGALEALAADHRLLHGMQRPVGRRQALDAAREFVPELVITDIQLPHVSGLELIRLIRADEQLKEVPIMAVTAYASLGDEERIRGAGAESYVTKPISVARFVQEVDSLLGRKQPADAEA